MKHRVDSLAWRDILPATFHWTESVALKKADGVVAGGHHIVPVKANESGDDFNLLGKGIGDDVATKIKDATRAMLWKPSAGPVAACVDGSVFILTPCTQVKVGPVQQGRQLGLDAAKLVKDRDIADLVLCGTDDIHTLDMFDGLVNGLYTFDGLKLNAKAKAKSPSPLPKAVTLSGCKASDDEIKSVREFCRATVFTRFLQDGPPNFIRPEKLAEIAQDVAQDNGVACKILDRKAMEELGMGSMLSVSDGGDDEPRTIIVEIEGEDNSKCISLVGKGLTFDAGGISIKPSAGMDEMKYDMSGGAAVLGAAMYFGRVKPPVKVICLVGASENIPSATATVPGDVVKAMNGKTIEVLNTDAEGRLVLADVLCYAVENYKPDMIIDIATLTGAVLHALGSAGCAVMGNDQDTTSFVMQSAEVRGEPIWQLPLWPELEVKGDVGDLRNIAKANVRAGTIIGGVFLREFVGETKWCHLDIAATGWNCQATGYPKTGGTGYGMRTMVSACERYNK